MTIKHSHTIGEIEWGGKTYEIDWPFEPDDETETIRCDFGAIYLDGEQVGEVCAPLGETIESAEQVMDLALEAIERGEVER